MIFLGWFAVCMAVIMALPGQMGMKWRREPGEVASDREKLLIKIYCSSAFVVGIGMTVLTDLYIQNQGYKLGF
jgi:hypothetical protein